MVEGEVLEALGDRGDPVVLVGERRSAPSAGSRRSPAAPRRCVSRTCVDRGGDRLEDGARAGGAVQQQPVGVLLRRRRGPRPRPRCRASRSRERPGAAVRATSKLGPDPVRRRARRGRRARPASRATSRISSVCGVVLEGEAPRPGGPTRGDVARHLERPGGLAQALRPAEQHQLAGAETAGQRLVEQVEAGRPDARRGVRRRRAAARRPAPGRRCRGSRERSTPIMEAPGRATGEARIAGEPPESAAGRCRRRFGRAGAAVP